MDGRGEMAEMNETFLFCMMVMELMVYDFKRELLRCDDFLAHVVIKRAYFKIPRTRFATPNSFPLYYDTNPKISNNHLCSSRF